MKKRNLLTVAVLMIFLAGILALSGCGINATGDSQGEDLEQTKEITLYFANDQAEYVVAEKRTVKVEDANDTTLIAQAIVTELINGTESQQLHATIPDNTKLLTLEIKQNIAYVNFSEEFVTNHWGGTAGETMTIYSIVNSLTELDGIEKVQLLVEGEELETLGHAYLAEPIERSEGIIKN